MMVDDEPRPTYGINQAIELMRALPVDQNPELVVIVIKSTLESLKVKVADIIVDADRKTKDLEERVANLKRAIADFEKEIETRKEEIGRLEADHKETTNVRQRLELAEKAQRAQPPAAAKAKTG
jgi:peptidoglycan hydrolase CwlO-like protein